MKNLTSTMFVFAISIASLSFGNILLKLGMTRYDTLTAAGTPVARAIWNTPQITAGVLLMFIQFGCTMTLFKWGWDVSVVLPVMGLCYVVMAFLGKWMLAEPVNATRWFGIILIMAGVFFVARSGVPGKPN
jgi:drug/metabolite transporter (DMT)-like permease